MAGKVFFTADLHLGHTSILKFESDKRPFTTIDEHDAQIVERWNSKVDSRDSVWVLGDVLFGRRSFDLLHHLKGTKKLVLGNHDQYPIADYALHFSRVMGVAQYKGCILSHVPVHPNQLERRFLANIHGHLHSKSLNDPRYICVSLEHWDLYPAPAEEVMARVPTVS